MESLVENRESLDTFFVPPRIVKRRWFELKVDSTQLDLPRKAIVKEYCLISGAGVPEINGLYEKHLALKDNVGMYTKDGFEIFRNEYKPPTLPNDATPSSTKRWF